MKIYDIEKQDGLTNLIKNNSVAFTSKVCKGKSVSPLKSDLEKYAAKANANPDQIDLYYLNSILVNTGWNLNDDVFDSEETFAARNTPVDKQINLMHNEKDIIGHMTSSVVLVDGKEYEGDETPDDFQIQVGGVLYKIWGDEKLKERIETLIAEIEEDKWYVSMECVFRNFDYALVDKDGNESIVKRNKTTASLSKHLRAYGGSGTYDGYKIGRVLRNITFSGKGIVSDPANPESVIINEKTSKASVVNPQQEKKMTEELLKTRADELAKQVEELKNLNKTLEAEVKAKAESEHKKQLDDLNKTIADQLKAIETAQAELDAKNKTVAEITQSLEQAKTELAAAQKEVETLKASIKKAERVSELTKAGVDSEKHDELLTKFENVSDEIFKEFVELHAAKKEKAKCDDDMKGEEGKTEATKVEAEKAKEAEKALETAEVTDKAVASNASESDAAKNVRLKATEWLEGVFKSKANRGSYNIRNPKAAAN